MFLFCSYRFNAHIHAHWVEGLNKYWQHHASHLCRLIEDDLEMAEKEDGMNIEPLLPHSDVILYLVQDYKESVHVGRSFHINSSSLGPASVNPYLSR